MSSVSNSIRTLQSLNFGAGKVIARHIFFGGGRGRGEAFALPV